MYEGEIVGVLDADIATREGLGLLMAGERESASEPDTGGQVAKEEMP
jgi:hypothetical protein